jgi:phosphate acetyltransferase
MFINTEADLDQSPLRNRTFDDLVIGESASLVRVVGRDDIDLFATVSGDVNPAHLDPVFASTDFFGHVVAHGMWTGALVSAVLGTKLPGPGTIYLEQDLRFRKPVSPGDTITITVTVREKRPEKRIVVLDTRGANQRGEEVLNGSATVIAPDRAIEWPRVLLPDVALVRRDRYEHFIKEPLVAVLTAVETVNSRMPSTLCNMTVPLRCARDVPCHPFG